VKQENVKPAAEAAWSIGTSLMVSIATTIIVVGVLFAAAGWLASPTASARGTRRVIAPATNRYLPYCYGGLALLVGIYLLSASGVGLRLFLTVIVIGVMAAFGLHELHKQTEEEFPGLTYGEVLAPTRQRIETAVSDAKLSERASKIKLPEVKRPDIKRPGGIGIPDVRRPKGGRGAERRDEPQAPAVPPEPSRAEVMQEEDARLSSLERLATLHEKGVLTDEEFAAEKARLLNR